MRPIGCSETSLTNYVSMLRDIQERRRSHLHRRVSLKSGIHISTLLYIYIFFNFSLFIYCASFPRFLPRFHSFLLPSFLFVHFFFFPHIFSSFRLCFCYAVRDKHSTQKVLHYLAKEPGQWRRIKPV